MIRAILFLFLGLSGASWANAEISLDSKLLANWTRESSYPCAPPFKATYSKNGKTLVFFAAEHVFGPADEGIPALALLKKEIENFKPGGIVIERSVAPGKFSTRNLSGQLQRCQSPSGEFTCGEPTYAGIIAGKLKPRATVVGGEMDSKEINAAFVKKFGREELLIYNSLLILSGMREEGLSLADRKSRFIESLSRRVPIKDSEWSYSKLNQWLRKNTGADADDIETPWIEPRSDTGASLTQKIAAKYDSIREPQILKAVEGVINAKDKTMVVYGSGHFLKQAPVYAEAFGVPRIECLSGQRPNSPEHSSSTGVSSSK